MDDEYNKRSLSKEEKMLWQRVVESATRLTEPKCSKLVPSSPKPMQSTLQSKQCYRLDLHGFSEHDAHIALIDTVRMLRAQQLTSLLVITGKGIKGEGVLRKRLPVWISVAPLDQWIVSHQQAKHKDGGSGAFYLTLKK